MNRNSSLNLSQRRDSLNGSIEIFEQEAVNFARAAEKFGKILGKEVVEPEMWKKCHQNFREMARYPYHPY